MIWAQPSTSNINVMMCICVAWMCCRACVPYGIHRPKDLLV
jgi:hypothetical protein